MIRSLVWVIASTTALASVCPIELHGQETIAADRPGFWNGTFVLKPGTMHFESGLQLAEAGSIKNYSFGQVLMRFGVPKVELQAHLNSIVFTPDSGGDDSGIQDMAVGLKARLLELPKAALSVHGVVQLPTGAKHLTSDEWIPSGALLCDLSVSESATASGNLGYTAGPGRTKSVVSLLLAFSRSLESVGVYVGYGGFISDPGNAHSLEGGVTYLARHDLQLDLNGGFDVDTKDYFIGVGLATRWSLR